MRARFAMLVLAWCARAASADSAAELQARGEELARDRRFTEAIAAFKAADRLEPQPSRSCFIALAYTRRELWPQAEIFLARCRTSASPPEWVPEAEQLVAERLATASVARVDITIVPAGAAVALSVSSFEPDETFGPNTVLHLPIGHHVIVATAAGFEPARQAVEITDRSPRRVAIELHAAGSVAHERAKRRFGGRLMVAGAIALGVGTASYAVMAVAWNDLRQHQGANFGTPAQSTYELGRATTIVAWAIGASLVIGGYALRRSARVEHVSAGVIPTRGGALVAFEWR